MAQLKCFQGNLDGLRRGLVIASNQKDAAQAAGCSVYAFREMWSSVGKQPTGEFKTNTLYTLPYDDRGGQWVEGRCEVKR